MKLWTLTTFLTVSLLILSGCGAKATPKKQAVIDETLPMVELTKKGTMPDINAIAFEWTLIEDNRVEGIYIYKVELDKTERAEDEYYDTVENRFSTHYLDTNISPDSKYSYYFKTYSSKAESKKSNTTVIKSLPLMESVAWIQSLQNMPRSAKIIWRPHTNEKVKGYLIQRRTLQDDKWEDIATVDGRLRAEFIDENLKDNFTYLYRIRVVTYDRLISKPSNEVKVITKSLPKELTKIKTTTNLPRKIAIEWEKTDSLDFLQYNIYRSDTVKGNYKFLISLSKNSYVDVIEEDGKQYFYRVSVIDKDGLESVYKNYSIQGTTLVKPKTPALVEVKLVNSKVNISWSKSDNRVKSYTVQKKYSKSFFQTATVDYENITNTQFIDPDIEPNKTYYYKVFGVDKDGINSEPSIEVEIKTDKIPLNEK